jgi:2-polyprenyl-6-hydroxyphenyl methylase/3-demethylubiquinone-9 3-methyltransferase
MKLPALRPLSTAPQPCKICGGAAPLFGVVDFNKHCVTPGHSLRLPLSGVPVYYRQCASCDFLYTDAFDDWSIEDFRAHIYNEEYALADPEYALKRPRDNADFVEQFWGELRTTGRLLDFGGGNDVMCATLREKGFTTAVSYDPIVPEFSQRPDGKFELVTCFETMEHMPDPVGGIAKIIECSAEPGLICYSTCLLPTDLHLYGLSWWYVAPRNGHVSMFSKRSLAAAWGRHGYKTVSFNNCTHFAFRTLPSYLAHMQDKVDNAAQASSQQTSPQGGPMAA